MDKESTAHPLEKSPARFYALDATRAFALLLGVVFHGAWFYVNEPLSKPVTDVSANHFLAWFFHTSHTFRMQLFFLIAGFFASLVIQKRGLASFMRNRLVRIGIPLAVGWLILFPLLVMVWVWGRNLSGQNPVEIPPHLAGIGTVLSGAMFVEKADGGAFSLTHFWFLYYLLFFYFLVMVAHPVLTRTRLGNRRSLARLDRFARFLVSGPLGALTLAALCTPLLWSMTGWFGIDTPAWSRTPIVKVATAYFVFFALGWFVHRQAQEIGSFFCQWKLYLAAGLALSFGLYGFYLAVRPYDTKNPPHAISYRDVEDWSAFRASLVAAGEVENLSRPDARVWSAMGERLQGFAAADSATFDQHCGILTMVNQVLADPDLLTSEFRTEVSIDEPRTSETAVIKINRVALQPFLTGVAAGDYREASWYLGTKLAYSALYSVVMIFLVYGTLGAFQSACRTRSLIWRYLADSSYWVYLAHIPLLPAIEILVFDWPISAFIKLPLVCVISLLILYASYHYLVRSTLIGQLLNGRRYPFTANPFTQLRCQDLSQLGAGTDGSTPIQTRQALGR